MNTWQFILIIGATLLVAFILYKILKPYFIKYDTTILFTGGLGSGKTCESVKKTNFLIKKNTIQKYYLGNFIIKYFKNPKIKHDNLKQFKQYCQKLNNKRKTKWIIKKYIKLRKKPLVYSNMPISYKLWLFGKRYYSVKLTIEHICLLREIEEYSIVLIDEFPQFISQFEWDVELVQKNCNEFITFFRHYIGGHLIINAQSEEEIECHFRRKLNTGIWCFNFHVWPFSWLPIFYTNKMCDFQISENIQTMSTTYIEENTKLHFGLIPRKSYDTRCYSPRYEKVHEKIENPLKWTKLKTKEVLRIKQYTSPLDTKTTTKQIERMIDQVEKLKRNEDR